MSFIVMIVLFLSIEGFWLSVSPTAVKSCFVFKLLKGCCLPDVLNNMYMLQHPFYFSIKFPASRIALQKVASCVFSVWDSIKIVPKYLIVHDLQVSGLSILFSICQ